MKIKFMMGVMLMTSMLSFAQKDEIKAAEKALKKENYSEAISALKSLEGSIDSADEKYQVKYYHVLGVAAMSEAIAGTNTYENIDKSLAAFDKLKALDSKGKYTDEVAQLKSKVVNKVFEMAKASLDAEDLEASYKGYEKVYRLSPADTIMLFNSGVIAYQNKDVDQAIKYFEELKDLNFDGSTMQYFATNKETNEQEPFANKQTRDLMVKGGSHINPEDQKTASKRSEIIKLLAYCYLDKDEHDKALEAFAEAKAQNPDDVNLVISEANVYLKMDDMEKFKQSMIKASEMEPNNANVQYNIGAVSLDQKDYEGARKALRKALEIKPNYEDAAINISATYINEANDMLEGMNALGNSQADVKKYNELAKEREAMLNEATVDLEAYLKVNPTANNSKVLAQLKNLYGSLGDNENFMRIKKLIGE